MAPGSCRQTQALESIPRHTRKSLITDSGKLSQLNTATLFECEALPPFQLREISKIIVKCDIGSKSK
jgi:hypothetical protein